MGFTWQNGEPGGTPVSAANLNALLQQADLDDEVAYILGNPTSALSLAVDQKVADAATPIAEAEAAEASAAAVAAAGVSAATASQLVRRDSSGRARFATPSNTADAATKGYVDGLTTGRVVGVSGRVYNVLAGVVRNTGSGWGFIEDSGHQPSNLTSVSASSSGITINFGVTGVKVSSVVAGPDETFAQEGYFVGSSVGLSNLVLRIGKVAPVLADYVSYSGGAFSSTNGVFTIGSFSSGILNLGHPSTPGFAVSIAGRGGTYQPQIESVGDSLIQVTWRDWAGALATTANTNMRAFVTRQNPAGVVAVDPTTLVSASGNFWVLGLIETV